MTTKMQGPPAQVINDGTTLTVRFGSKRTIGATKAKKDFKKHLSVLSPGAFFAPAYKRYIKWKAVLKDKRSKGPITPEGQEYLDNLKRGTWDGKIRFYQHIEGCEYSCAATLLAYLEKKGWVKEHRPAIINTHKTVMPPKGKVKYPLPEFPKTKNRDYSYQKEVSKPFIQGARRSGILDLAPNAGKSEIAAMLIAGIGVRTIVSSYSKIATETVYERLRKYFGSRNVGAIMGGMFDIKPVTVICWPSVQRRKLPSEIYNAPLWISDECHRNVKNQQDFAAESKAHWRIGMTGTLKKGKLNTLQYTELFGSVVRRIDEKELEDRGISAKATHLFLTYKGPQIDEDRALDIDDMRYTKWYRKCIVNNQWRNDAITRLVKRLVKTRKRGLVFVRMVKHGKILVRRLLRMGIKAEYVHGQVHDRDVQEAQEALRKGKISVLIGTSIIGTGMSINEVGFTVSAVGEYSPVRRKQEVGRAARHKGDVGNFAWNFDLWDDTTGRMLKHTRNRWRVLKGTRQTCIKGDLTHLMEKVNA